MNNEYNNFRIEYGEHGVTTIWLDVPDRPVNVFDETVIIELEQIVDQLETNAGVAVVVFRSGKESGFLAGADVNTIAQLHSPEQVETICRRGQDLFDRIERFPVPTVAAIHGPCLGGGMEFALACTYRLVRDDSSTRLGLPETQLGLLPAWGGTQRLPRLIGLVDALPMILQGKKVSAQKAKRLGLADIIASPDDFETELKILTGRLIRGPKPSRKTAKSWWTGKLNSTRLGRWLVFRLAKKRIARQAKNYPALPAAMEAIRRGLQQSFDEGLQFERDAFTRLLFTDTARNLMGLFFQRERARNFKLISEGDDAAVPKIEKVAVIGAGAMGAGIAQLAAYQGFEVVVKEINDEALEAGMERIGQLFDDAVTKKRLRSDEAEARMSAITPTTEWETLADADLVIEAIIERADVKHDLFRELDQRVSANAIIVSNTSALSVTEMGSVTERPNQVAGLHFFNPVHRMDLVEVVQTEQTSAATMTALLKFVRKLGKTPVVTADAPGFLVNRVLFPYLGEAVRLVCEGHEAAAVDRVMKRFGMPMGPLELLDQVGIDVAAHVAKSMEAVLSDAELVAKTLTEMVDDNRLGKKSGRGFYEYNKGKKRNSIPLNANSLTTPKSTLADFSSETDRLFATLGDRAAAIIGRRLAYPLINETARCLSRGVVAEAWMADLAMVLGTGFAPFRGGPLRLADKLGIESVVDDLRILNAEFGPRFTPCKLLVEMAEQDRQFFIDKQSTKETAREVVSVEG